MCWVAVVVVVLVGGCSSFAVVAAVSYSSCSDAAVGGSVEDGEAETAVE